MRAGPLRATLTGVPHDFGFEPPSTLPGREGPVEVHAIYFDPAEPVLDNGVLHGRSAPERGVRFSEDASAAGRGRRVLVAWVATPANSADAPFIGAVVSDFWIDASARTGYKKLAVHTNGICAAAGGKVDVAPLSPAQRGALAALLAQLSPGGWARTSPLFKLFLSAAT